MQTNFTLTIDNIKLDFISMNRSHPKLFQVFATIGGEKKRYHMQGNGIDVLEFVLQEECPKDLLAIQDKISAEIFALHNAKA